MEIKDLASKPKDFVPKGKYVVRTPVDQQRIKLEKLMENPDKPVIIPASKQQKNLLAAVPTFVRNVMGSSAGAGSGEFHVYRHLRRKEFARQKQIQHKSRQEELDDEFQQKIENHQNIAESKTAKKRAKRLKRKLALKHKPKRGKQDFANKPSESTDSSDDDDDNGEDDATQKKRSKQNDDNSYAKSQSDDEQENVESIHFFNKAEDIVSNDDAIKSKDAVESNGSDNDHIDDQIYAPAPDVEQPLEPDQVQPTADLRNVNVIQANVDQEETESSVTDIVATVANRPQPKIEE